MNIESDKDEVEMTQTSTPATPGNMPKSIAPMIEQEHAIHQLNDDLTKLSTDNEEEVPIN
ncbi:hypothetical protein J1N35_011456 [Gossypium stocksii]|uniref:Uncharacterized protein n=1 Tax=Gossypium stocksii TaxID=47602 RepID=A0A9D3W499_9ROSI|nr:hypothetical protein J1N35_011456 [Gossypium stocksii]